ncbi:MAG: integrase arm-type DNA-binding domain-containing protein [Roseococcus sp.]|nr:integrase arm-type DNA-binding domain-containing protein [Roseococcus sp.]
MPRRSAEKITARAAEAQGAGILWDRDIAGFGLRTTPAGAKTWLLKYRARGGQQHWHRIGSYPAMTAEEARKAAARLRADVDHGRDPTAERAKEARRAKAERATMLAPLVETYALALPGRPRLRGSGPISAEHAADELAAVRRAVALLDIAGRPVSEVTAADVARLMRIEASRPATARMLFGALRRFFAWSREEGHLAGPNPCEELPQAKRPRPPAARSRVIALEDLARLWRAAGTLDETPRDLARILIALPARRGEAAAMRWQDVDLKRAEWLQPGTMTKNGDPHRLALPPLALRILAARHEAAKEPSEGLVFPSSVPGRVLDRWTDMRETMSTAAGGFTAWTWHDFRRSFASIMAERGIPEPVADAVLNHRQSATRGGVLGVYQRAERWQEQAAAVRAWCDALAAALDPASRPQTVVPIRAGRGKRA